MTPQLRRRLGVIVGIALVLPLVLQSGASGDPIADKQAEAARIQDQLDAQGKKVSIADEQFNRAQLHLTDVQNQMAQAQTNLQQSSDRLTSVKGLLAQAAIDAYVDGGNSTILSQLVKAGDANTLVARSQYLQVAAGDDRAIMGQLQTAKDDYSAVKVKLTAEEKDAQAAADAAAAARKDAVNAQNAQLAILKGVQGELATLVANEAAKRLAAQATQVPPALVQVPAAVPTKSAGTVSPASASSPTVVASGPSSAAAIAVRTAEAQLGKPYVYGGSGPDSFDCSGLTSFAWRAAGVSLSHDAYQQWFETTRVSLDAIQPGDLLFFGDNGVASIHHVAMYVGNGQMIEAPTTGIPVRYRGWRAPDLVGAGRPG